MTEACVCIKFYIRHKLSCTSNMLFSIWCLFMSRFLDTSFPLLYHTVQSSQISQMVPPCYLNFRIFPRFRSGDMASVTRNTLRFMRILDGDQVNISCAFDCHIHVHWKHYEWASMWLPSHQHSWRSNVGMIRQISTDTWSSVFLNLNTSPRCYNEAVWQSRDYNEKPKRRGKVKA